MIVSERRRIKREVKPHVFETLEEVKVFTEHTRKVVLNGNRESKTRRMSVINGQLEGKMIRIGER